MSESVKQHSPEVTMAAPQAAAVLGPLATSGEVDRNVSLPSKRPNYIVSLPTQEGRSVHLTALEDFGNIAAPTETFAVPPNIIPLTQTDITNPNTSTYQNTVKTPGWQQEVFGIVTSFLTDDPYGRRLVKELGISSLGHLTPGQAARLSVRFTQAVSKYTHSDVERKGATRADKSDAPTLLKEGAEQRYNPAWDGNGVCRNIAANTVAVFESLKAMQGEGSLLCNTYCAYDRGYGGDGYVSKRPDEYSMSFGPQDGHAWNVFVNITDEKGSAEVSIVDATWALGITSQNPTASIDRTLERGARLLTSMSKESTDREHVFHALTQYYDKLATHGLRKNHMTSNDISAFALTEYLKVAREFPEGVEGINVPHSILSTAYHMRGQLDPSELQLLFRHDDANGGLEVTRLRAIIHDNFVDGKVLSKSRRADRLVYADSKMQQLVYGSFAPTELQEIAAVSPLFRTALRADKPELLPAFDPSTRQEDAEELRHLATEAGVMNGSLEKVMSEVRRNIRRSAAGNETIVNALLVARSAYDIIKHARVLMMTAKQLSVAS